MFTKRALVLVLAANCTVFSQYIGASQYGKNITEELGVILSPGASITTNISSAARWSDYHAPQAGYIVHVAEEQDVAQTVWPHSSTWTLSQAQANMIRRFNTAMKMASSF